MKRRRRRGELGGGDFDLEEFCTVRKISRSDTGRRERTDTPRGQAGKETKPKERSEKSVVDG
jgi:hypothetical protein